MVKAYETAEHIEAKLPVALASKSVAAIKGVLLLPAMKSTAAPGPGGQADAKPPPLGLVLRRYGGSLASLIERHFPHGMPLGPGFGVCERVARAVLELNEESGRPHLNLKPTNVLFESAGGAEALASQSPVLTDWAEPRLKNLAYAAPETVRNDAPKISGRSDVYSLGLIFHYVLTGRGAWPAEAADIDIINAIIIRREGPSVAAVPAPVRALLGAMVQVEAAARPSLQHVVDAVGRLQAQLGTGTEVDGPTLVTQLDSAERGVAVHVPSRERDPYPGFGTGTAAQGAASASLASSSPSAPPWTAPLPGPRRQAPAPPTPSNSALFPPSSVPLFPPPPPPFTAVPPGPPSSQLTLQPTDPYTYPSATAPGAPPSFASGAIATPLSPSGRGYKSESDGLGSGGERPLKRLDAHEALHLVNAILDFNLDELLPFREYSLDIEQLQAILMPLLSEEGANARLVFACRRDAEPHILRILVNACGASPDAVNLDAPFGRELGRTVLVEAIMSFSVAVAETLIHLGADVNKPTAHGATPLRIACFVGCQPLVQLLLERGADVNARFPLDGSTPAFVACQQGHLNVVRELSKHDRPMADFRIPRYRTGSTCLHIAVCMGHPQVVAFLVNMDLVDTEARDSRGVRAIDTPRYKDANVKGHALAINFLRHRSPPGSGRFFGWFRVATLPRWIGYLYCVAPYQGSLNDHDRTVTTMVDN